MEANIDDGFDSKIDSSAHDHEEEEDKEDNISTVLTTEGTENAKKKPMNEEIIK